jgi:hypothetical protein
MDTYLVAIYLSRYCNIFCFFNMLVVRTVFHTVDVRSLRPSRSVIHHHVLSNLLQKNEKRQRTRRCLYRGHSDAKVKI